MKKLVIVLTIIVASLTLTGCVKTSEPTRPAISQSEVSSLMEMEMLYFQAKSPYNRIAIGRLIEKRIGQYDKKSLPSGVDDFLKAVKSYRDSVKVDSTKIPK